MYPYEFVRLIECSSVPRSARQLYVLAAYVYARPQELFALRWTDVDWTAEEIRIRRKLNVRKDKEVHGTKSDAGIREVPIHPNLMPLLRALHDVRSSDGARIVDFDGSPRILDLLPDQARQHLEVAGIERTELIEGTEDFLAFDFRSFRTTGCTWLAMLGTDSFVIAAQAGHENPSTTWGSYIRRGPDLRRRLGEPFPPLPAELLKPDPEFWLESVCRPKQTSGKQGDSVARARDDLFLHPESPSFWLPIAIAV
jgi:integrase